MPPFIVTFRLTCCASSHEVLYSLILYSRQTRIEPLESMYSIQSIIPRVLHFSLTIREHLHIASWLSTTPKPISAAKRLASKDKLQQKFGTDESHKDQSTSATSLAPAHSGLLASGRAAVCRSFAHSYRGRDDNRVRISGKLRGGAGQSRA